MLKSILDVVMERRARQLMAQVQAWLPTTDPCCLGSGPDTSRPPGGFDQVVSSDWCDLLLGRPRCCAVCPSFSRELSRPRFCSSAPYPTTLGLLSERPGHRYRSSSSRSLGRFVTRGSHPGIL